MTEEVPAHDLDRFQLSVYMLERRFPLISHPSCSDENAEFELMAYHDGARNPVIGPNVDVEVDWHYQALRAQQPQ